MRCLRFALGTLSIVLLTFSLVTAGLVPPPDTRFNAASNLLTLWWLPFALVLTSGLALLLPGYYARRSGDLVLLFDGCHWFSAAGAAASIEASYLSPGLLAARPGGLVGAFLNSPPLQFLGRISYSIYLVHALVLLVAGTLLEIALVRPVPAFRGAAEGLLRDAPGLLLAGILAAVIALSALTWWLVERPGQALFRRWAGIDR